MLKKGRIRREEREREQEKAYVKRRISSEKEREKEIQNIKTPENRLKRGHQQREANHKGSEEKMGVSRFLSRFSLTLRFKPFFTDCRLVLASVHNSNHVSVKPSAGSSLL